MPKHPALGSKAFHAPSAQVVHVTASTCHNLSVFKELMKEYRKLDDTVTMRMNRNLAQFRDRERLGPASGGGGMQDEACAYFWKELVAGWKARTEIVQYCIDVADKGMDEKRAAFVTEDSSLDQDALRRKHDALLYGEEVKRNQLHNELIVERIVRRRSLEAFQSRCRYFEPPRTDAEARKWWDAASAGR